MVSVRGEARMEVPPDSASLTGTDLVGLLRGDACRTRKATGEYRPTGNVTATVAIEITIRAFGQLTEVSATLARHRRDVLHVADAGLLGREGSRWQATSAADGRGSRQRGDPDVPDLSPTPQELAAVIEARFSMRGVSVAGSPD